MTPPSAGRAWSWPDAARGRAWLRFLLLFYLFFFPTYFGAASLAQARGAWRLYAAWELTIPLAPAAILPYAGLIPCFGLPALQMTAREITALSRQASATTLAAFAIFVAAPTRIGFAPPDLAEPWASLFLIGALSTPFNAAPSLHVAFAALIFGGCAQVATAPLRAVYALAFVSVAASTVLAHQHHLLDVASGLALALIVRRLWPLGADPRASPAPNR